MGAGALHGTWHTWRPWVSPPQLCAAPYRQFAWPKSSSSCANCSLCIDFLLHFFISQEPLHLCTTPLHGHDPLLVVARES